MTESSSTDAIDLPFSGKPSQGGHSRNSQCPSAPIHILDDDSLLNVFSRCRPLILGDCMHNFGEGEWDRARWWYGLVKVCRRWRHLVYESAFHLRLSLVCTRGTPVADMLAHSPSLPLTIDHFDEYQDITAEDEEGIIFALQHHDRVRHVRLLKPILILQKLVIVLDGEFPNLEYVLIKQQRYRKPMVDPNTNLNLPESFRAPHLRHLVLMNFAIPIKSPTLTTIGNLVNLLLELIPPSAYFHPNALLKRLSLMPQLEALGITFNSNDPLHDAERQLIHAPTMTGVTLPNLRWVRFQGVGAYLEAFLPRVTAPLLEKLNVRLFAQLHHSTPHLDRFLSTAENLRLNNVTLKVTFRNDYVNLMVYPHTEVMAHTLLFELGGPILDVQALSAGSMFHQLSAVCSAVEDLTVEYKRPPEPWSDETVDRIVWRFFLETLDNVKTLRVDNYLAGKISCALQPGEAKELLPKFIRKTLL